MKYTSKQLQNSTQNTLQNTSERPQKSLKNSPKTIFGQNHKITKNSKNVKLKKTLRERILGHSIDY